MCGRISTADLISDELRQLFGLQEAESIVQSYNIAPTVQVSVVRQMDEERRLDAMRWGLIPHWAKERVMQIVAFNARIETVTEKPFFRNAFKSRRCIVPVSGFYEWQQLAEHKQPYYIYRGDQKPLALAGLWDSWRDPETGESIDSCSVITLPAAGALTDLHERMPAVLESDYFDPWLDPDYHETEVLLEILRQTDPARLNFYPVTSYVSNSRHDGAQCLEQQS